MRVGFFILFGIDKGISIEIKICIYNICNFGFIYSFFYKRYWMVYVGEGLFLWGGLYVSRIKETFWNEIKYCLIKYVLN